MAFQTFHYKTVILVKTFPPKTYLVNDFGDGPRCKAIITQTVQFSHYSPDRVLDQYFVKKRAKTTGP